MTGKKDIIEEIRQSRRRMSLECGHNIRRYIRALKRFNIKYSAQVTQYRQTHRAPAPVRR
ncbi:hypothetical protein HY522_04335 [bacterium]|nr:hypothetical protein [bacterium]